MKKTIEYVEAAAQALTAERDGQPLGLAEGVAGSAATWRQLTHRAIDLALTDAQAEQQQLTAAIDYVGGLQPLPAARPTQQQARDLVSAVAEQLAMGGLGCSAGVAVKLRLGHVPSFEHEDWYRIAVEATERALLSREAHD